MAEDAVLRQLGRMEALHGLRRMVSDTCGDGQGSWYFWWFGTRDAIDGWRIEARPAVRSVFNSPE
jgi:hypothetical protein